MHSVVLDTKDTTHSNTSYLDLHLTIVRGGQLPTLIYDKSDDFNFHLTNFSFLSTNFPSSPTHCVFISPFIRYAGLVTHMDVSFLGQNDFPISFSDRNTSRKVSNRLWKSCIVNTGISSNNTMFLFSRILNDILMLDHKQYDTLRQSDF